MDFGKTICFIGNDSNLPNANDGQTLKVRLYRKLFDNERINYTFVNLHNWKKRIFPVIFELKKCIKNCDVILLMAGPRGSRKLIPLINYLNRRKKKKFVCSMIGRGTLSFPVDGNHIDSNDFFINGNYHDLKDEKIKKELKKVDCVVLETDILTNTYTKFYELTNCTTICNFRDISLRKEKFNDTKLNLGYFSRVCRYKGIFVLLEAFEILRNKGFDISLDIYGKEEFDNDDKALFDSYLDNFKSIHYYGAQENSKVLSAMTQADCFVFPSICSEGMPGSLIESLIIGLPIISSNFTQSKDILTNEFDSLIYDANNVNDLVDKITRVYNNRQLLTLLSKNALESGKKFSLSYNKNKLFEIL